ncbi:uncharacterized protein LOC122951267 [Acropora millepora]|uniref:uncharacterized protein LOC122951267 n=1 Tax=Acropora millepora TaxID=45264 RepID=UPI001CF3D172|nr:uncharacterized protein LOC122951267 [Acropora millepora]
MAAVNLQEELIMAPFRWPEARHELALAKEVAQHSPEKPDEWDAVAKRLGKAFSTDSCSVELKGRGCREKMDRILTKYKEEDMKGLKRSGTEEEFTEIQQLCEDILVYRRDMIEIRKIEKESRMRKDQEDKRKGEEMRQAAVERLAKRRSDAGTSGGATCDVSSSGSDEETPSKADITKTFRHQKLEHTEAATRAHSLSETLSLCVLTMDKHNFLTVDKSEPSFTFGRTGRTSFL